MSRVFTNKSEMLITNLNVLDSMMSVDKMSYEDIAKFSSKIINDCIILLDDCQERLKELQGTNSKNLDLYIDIHINNLNLFKKIYRGVALYSLDPLKVCKLQVEQPGEEPKMVSFSLGSRYDTLCQNLDFYLKCSLSNDKELKVYKPAVEQFTKHIEELIFMFSNLDDDVSNSQRIFINFVLEELLEGFKMVNKRIEANG